MGPPGCEPCKALLGSASLSGPGLPPMVPRWQVSQVRGLFTGSEDDGISSSQDRQEGRPSSALFTGVLLGVGIIGFADEALLHQILQWHAFYWGTDQHARILSDGLFHVGSTALLI